jgi:hypothetical protein
MKDGKMKLIAGLIIGGTIGAIGSAVYIWWQFAKTFRDNF